MGMIIDRKLMESIARCKKDIGKRRIISLKVYEKKYINNSQSVECKPI
jgi:hypothetical protein